MVFRFYICSFTGSGCFSIVKFQNNKFRFFFRIRLHKDDIKVLQKIAHTLNLLPPFLDGKYVVLQVTDMDKIINTIIPIFINVPLLTQKSSDFNKFYKAVEIKKACVEKTPLASNLKSARAKGKGNLLNN